MAYAPVRSIIPSLKIGDYLSVQAHKPRSISHLIAALMQSSVVIKLDCNKARKVGTSGKSHTENNSQRLPDREQLTKVMT